MMLEKRIDCSINEYLDRLISVLREERTIEIMCHTAYLDQDLLNGSSFVYPRINQVEFLIHSDFAQQVKRDSLIELVTYKDI